MPTAIIIPCILLPYIILVIIFQAGVNMLQEYRANRTGGHLKLTVIVPFRNEASAVTGLARVLLDQDYPRENFELLFVDDHSEDGSLRELTKALAGSSNARVTGPPEGKGKMAALEKGLLEATFDCIVVTDADCRPGKGWLKTMGSFWSDTGSRLVIGPVLFGPLRGWTARMQALEYLSLTGITAGAAGLGKPIMGSGANMMFRREDFLEFLEGGDPGTGSGEDVFFVGWMRKRHRGRVKYLLSEEAFVYTPPVGNLADFIGQRFRWASKGRYYRDPLLVTVTLVVFLFSLCLVVMFVLSFFVPGLFRTFLIMFAGKCLTDLIFLTDVSMKFRQGRLLKAFLPSELLHPFYIVFAGMLGNLVAHTWKGRLGRIHKRDD